MKMLIVNRRGHTLEKGNKLGCLLFLRSMGRLKGIHKCPKIE